MKLYFVRHGKTEWNLEGRFQGMYGDSPLLPTSHHEIRLLGQYLQEVPFQAIYASPLSRAKLTAEGIQKELLRPTEIVLDNRLREMNYGKIEGQEIKQSLLSYERELNNLYHAPEQYDCTVFQGEAIPTMLNRMENAIQAAVATHEGPLLFVGHGTALTATIQHLVGKPLAELRDMGGLLNNSLSIVETQKDGPYQLQVWNDVNFLK